MSITRLYSIILLGLTALFTHCPPASANDNAQPQRLVQHVIRTNISPAEKAVNIGIVYACQWGYYLLAQRDTIKSAGSFRNWYTHMGQPHFDNDNIDYNLILHTLTGMGYYLFYRSRGYSKPAAFLWSALSHVLFEFTIETITEKPSLQDLFQTPVLGTLLGVTVEWLSYRLLSSRYVIPRAFGFLLNPFLLLPGAGFQVTATRKSDRTEAFYAVTVSF